ncbi:hypothetical protein, partial [Nitratifractor sp.]
MKKIIGYLKDLVGRYYAKDAEGHLRELHPGDPVFAGEIVVNAEGKPVPDALRAPKTHQLENTLDEEQATATPTDEEQPDHHKKPLHTHAFPPPTEYHDILESNHAEQNIEAPLYGEIHTTGLIRSEFEGEVDVNAVLHEASFGEEEHLVFGTGHHPKTAPVAHNDVVSNVVSGQPVTINVVGNDSDPENDIDPTTVRLIDSNGDPVTTLTVS